MRSGLAILLLAALLLAGCGKAKIDPTTPEGAIRKYVADRAGTEALQRVRIKHTGLRDRTYGDQYRVDGYFDPETGTEYILFYVKRGSDGVWIVTWRVAR